MPSFTTNIVGVSPSPRRIGSTTTPVQAVFKRPIVDLKTPNRIDNPPSIGIPSPSPKPETPTRDSQTPVGESVRRAKRAQARLLNYSLGWSTRKISSEIVLKADAVERALRNERSQPDKLEYDQRYITDEFYDKYNLTKDPGTPTKHGLTDENPAVIPQKRQKTVDSGNPETTASTDTTDDEKAMRRREKRARKKFRRGVARDATAASVVGIVDDMTRGNTAGQDRESREIDMGATPFLVLVPRQGMKLSVSKDGSLLVGY